MANVSRTAARRAIASRTGPRAVNAWLALVAAAIALAAGSSPVAGAIKPSEPIGGVWPGAGKAHSESPSERAEQTNRLRQAHSKRNFQATLEKAKAKTKRIVCLVGSQPHERSCNASAAASGRLHITALPITENHLGWTPDLRSVRQTPEKDTIDGQ